MTVCKINGSIRFQIHDHFRPSDPTDKSVYVARLVVLRIGHELNAAIVEATHPGPHYTLACLGFQPLPHSTDQRRLCEPLSIQVPDVWRRNSAWGNPTSWSVRRERHGMENASDADLKQIAEDPEDAPLVAAAAEESDETAASPTNR